jgi:hypothetical protein
LPEGDLAEGTWQRGLGRGDLADASPVDSVRHPHRMPATCRPEKAARFVFLGLVVDAIHARIAAGSNLQ